MTGAATAPAPAQRALCPVAPLTGRKLTPAVPGPRPEQLWVQVSALVVDPAYQRALGPGSHSLIRHIVEHWDWRLVQAITVAELPGGRWELIDGQHRAIAAATHGGIHMLPATVLPAGDVASAADSFVRMNTRRRAVRGYEQVRARLLMQEPEALAIARACDAAGMTLLTTPAAGNRYPPATTIAIGTLDRLLAEEGELELREILSICARAGLAPAAAIHLKAVALLRGDPAWRDHDPDLLIEALADSDDLIDRIAAHPNPARLSRAQLMAAELYRRATPRPARTLQERHA